MLFVSIIAVTFFSPYVPILLASWKTGGFKKDWNYTDFPYDRHWVHLSIIILTGAVLSCYLAWFGSWTFSIAPLPLKFAEDALNWLCDGLKVFGVIMGLFLIYRGLKFLKISHHESLSKFLCAQGVFFVVYGLVVFRAVNWIVAGIRDSNLIG